MRSLEKKINTKKNAANRMVVYWYIKNYSFRRCLYKKHERVSRYSARGSDGVDWHLITSILRSWIIG